MSALLLVEALGDRRLKLWSVCCYCWSSQSAKSLHCFSSASTWGWSYCCRKDSTGFVLLAQFKGVHSWAQALRMRQDPPPWRGIWSVLWSVRVFLPHPTMPGWAPDAQWFFAPPLAPKNRRDIGGISPLGAIPIFCFHIFYHKISLDLCYYNIRKANMYFNLASEKSQFC